MNAPSLRPPLRIHREGFGADAALDTAVSHALLRAVSDGEAPESLRLYRPSDALAFSMLDRTRPGFGAAVEVAAEQGFAPILRLAGGRAAAFESRGLAFAWTVPAQHPRTGIRARFDALTAVLERALRRLGVDARVGEVPGEYCPGEFSINAGGRVKLAGVGQRVLRGAAHVGGVLIVERAVRVREVLEPVYRELDFPLDVDTVGAVDDEVPGVDADAVVEAFVAEIAARRRVEPEFIPAPILESARQLLTSHDARREAASREALQQAGKIVSASG